MIFIIGLQYGLLTHSASGKSSLTILPDAFRSICVDMHDIRIGYNILRYVYTKQQTEECTDSQTAYVYHRQKEIASALLEHYVADRISYTLTSLNGRGQTRRKSQIVMDSCLKDSASQIFLSDEDKEILVGLLLEFQNEFQGTDPFGCNQTVTESDILQAVDKFVGASQLWALITKYFGWFLIPFYKKNVNGGYPFWKPNQCIILVLKWCNLYKSKTHQITSHFTRAQISYRQPLNLNQIFPFAQSLKSDNTQETDKNKVLFSCKRQSLLAYGPHQIHKMLLINNVLSCALQEHTNMTVARENAGIVTTLSSRGFKKYMDYNIDFSSTFLEQIQIPDMDFKISNFQFVLRDIHMSQVTMPKINFVFTDSGWVAADMRGFQMKMTLTFSLQQKTYPYMSDSGTGYILLEDFDINAEMRVDNDPDCFGHIKLSARNSRAKLGGLRIKLNGGLSIIYDAVMGLLSNSIEDMFSSTLNQLIMDMVISICNEQLAGIPTLSNNGGDFRTDQRWTNVYINETFIVAESPGQMCVEKNWPGLCVGVYNVTETKNWPTLRTNADVQYYIHRDPFQSVCKQYISTVVQEAGDIRIKDLIVRAIGSTGVRIHAVLGTEAETMAEFSYVAKVVPNLRQDFVNLTVAQFPMQPTQIFARTCRGSMESNQEQCDTLIGTAFEKLKELSRTIKLTYTNANGFRACEAIYSPPEWVLVACDLTREE